VTVNILVFTSTHCPHCASLLESFRRLQQQQDIEQLRIVNVEQQPQLAAEYNIRSVPWFRINDLEFFGAHTYQELSYWVKHADSNEGIQQYITRELDAGRLHTVAKLIKEHKAWLGIYIPALADLQLPLQARIGIGALLEEMAGDPALLEIIAPLAALLTSPHARVRSDACHFLGLINHPQARDHIRKCLADTDPTVREIATEVLAETDMN